MKFARPTVIGCLAFSLTFALLLFFSSAFINAVQPTIQTGASALPTRVAVESTPNPTASSTPGADVNVINSVTSQTNGDDTIPDVTAAPTDIPDVSPPPPPAVSSAAFQQGMTLRRDADYAHAADSFRAVLEEQPDPGLARLARFRLGESLWLAGDNANASAALNALLAEKSDDDLAARAHYFLGEIYLKSHAYTQALAQLRAYRAQTRALGGIIDAEIAAVLLASGDTPGALAQYATALKDPRLTAGDRVDLLEKNANAYSSSGQPAQAAARLGDALKYAFDDTTAAHIEYRLGLALDAAKQHPQAVAHWKHAVAAYPSEEDAYQSLLQLVNAREPVDDFARGMVDYYYGAYDGAIQAFNRYLNANPKHSAEPEYYAALAYQKNGAPSQAVKMFDQIINKHPGDRRVADAWYGKAGALARAGDSAGAAAAYFQFAALFPNDTRADGAIWQAASVTDDAGRLSQAASQYEQLVTRFPASPNAPAALFNAGWDYYLAHDTASAAARWGDIVKRYPASTQAARAQYWLGKLAQTSGNTATARQYFQQAAQAESGYYSWRALDALQSGPASGEYDLATYSMTPTTDEIVALEKWLASWTPGGTVSRKLKPAILNDPHFQRGVELAGLDRFAEAQSEFAQVNAAFKNDARALYALARYYQEDDQYLESILAARQIERLSPTSSRAQEPRYLRKLIYPTYFADLVVPYAQRNGFDPALFFGLVRQESFFDKYSTSWVSARGLTQVMPGTALGIAQDLGVRNFAQTDLFKPIVSIRFGTHFFGQLVKYFDGNIFYSLMGYNGGPGNAKKWQRPDVDVAVEIIHLPESYTYVRTVYSQYKEYVDIYRTK